MTAWSLISALQTASLFPKPVSNRSHSERAHFVFAGYYASGLYDRPQIYYGGFFFNFCSKIHRFLLHTRAHRRVTAVRLWRNRL